MTAGDDGIGPARLRELCRGLTAQDRAERAVWASTPATWWREGALDADTARTLGTVQTWCTMIDDDAGGVRADMLGSLAALAADGRLPTLDMQRLVAAFDAQFIPTSEREHAEALRAALGGAANPPRPRKGYYRTLTDLLRDLAAVEDPRRQEAVDAAPLEPGIAAEDRQALGVVSGWASASEAP